MCSSCRNSITPFSNNVNIVQLLFFSSLPRGDSLFLLKEAQTLGKNIRTECKEQKRGVIYFKTPNGDLGNLSKRPLNFFHWLRRTF
ncbi:hypothetical protein ACRRTK_022089 [Alexandromys fortis]